MTTKNLKEIKTANEFVKIFENTKENKHTLQGVFVFIENLEWELHEEIYVDENNIYNYINEYKGVTKNDY